MARSRRGSTERSAGENAERPYLLVPRRQFENELDERIELGQQLLEAEISDESELEAAQSDYYNWNEYNEELLKRRFSTPEVAEEYSYIGIGLFGGYSSLAEKVSDYRKDVSKKLRRLTSIKGRVELFEEAATVRRQEASPAEVRAAKAQPPESIFIVHGHDGEAKLAVHGLLREVTSVPAVILHDEPIRGRTLIEKFEEVGSASGFAVAILTADDEGRARGAEELLPRGRQNVVFEFGFFVGYLGRSRTVVLYEEGVELPSDLDGLVYIPYDDRGAWKMLLAKELNAAGVEVDLNKAL